MNIVELRINAITILIGVALYLLLSPIVSGFWFLIVGSLYFLYTICDGKNPIFEDADDE